MFHSTQFLRDSDDEGLKHTQPGTEDPTESHQPHRLHHTQTGTHTYIRTTVLHSEDEDGGWYRTHVHTTENTVVEGCYYKVCACVCIEYVQRNSAQCAVLYS